MAMLLCAAHSPGSLSHRRTGQATIARARAAAGAGRKRQQTNDGGKSQEGKSEQPKFGGLVI